MAFDLIGWISFLFAAFVYFSKDHIKSLFFLMLLTVFVSLQSSILNSAIEIIMGALSVFVLYYLVINTELLEREFYFEQRESFLILVLIVLLSYFSPYPVPVALTSLGLITLLLKKDLIKCLFGIQILQCGLFTFIHLFGEAPLYSIVLLNIASLFPLVLLTLVSIDIYKKHKTLDRKIIWRRYA